MNSRRPNPMSSGFNPSLHRSITCPATRPFVPMAFASSITARTILSGATNPLDATIMCSKAETRRPTRCLKELYISGMVGLRSTGPEFYFSVLSLRDRDQQPLKSLETMRFDNLPDWEDWLDIRVTNGDLFPSLKRFFILRCPELSGNLPTFLPSLISLYIHRCGPLGHFPNLDKLEFDHCTSLHALQLSQDLNALRNLRINDCQNLQRLPEQIFMAQTIQVTVSNCRYLRQPMEQELPPYHHPQFHLTRLNVSGSQRSHGSQRSYDSRSPSRYD